MIVRILHRLRSLWHNLVRRERAEQALDDELRAYVDLLAAEYERSGMTPALARRTALVDSGGIEQVKEATRDAWAGNAFATGARELRYALRSLRRSPAFLAIAIVTLAIGIGGATAVFTVIKASLLRPLPAAAEPDRLVTVEQGPTDGHGGRVQFPGLPRSERADDGAHRSRGVQWDVNGARERDGLRTPVDQLRHR
jgi:hypothetical protein